MSGAVYDTTMAVNGEQGNWSDWGIQLGIGAATGLLAGGSAGLAAKAAGAVGRSIGKQVVAYVAVGTLGGAVTGGVGQLLNNAATGRDLTTGLATAVGFGAAAGFAGSAISAGLARRGMLAEQELQSKLPQLRVTRTPMGYTDLDSGRAQLIRGLWPVTKGLASGGLRVAANREGWSVNWFEAQV
jgi:hypothetical protein